tara:strand:- start:2188 stop:2547 length:360 start_codon:yes stop_codon:yes gene_type:complete
MAGRRYNGRQLIVNDDMSYQESFFDKRDIKQLIQYDTARFYYPTPAERQAMNLSTLNWTATSKLYNLAFEYYGDPSLWWIIAWFNQKPTEAHFKIGDVFYIPLDYRQVIEFFQKQNGDI